MIDKLILSALRLLLLCFYRFKLMIKIVIFITIFWLTIFAVNLSYSYYKNISVSEWRVMSAWLGSYLYIGSKEYQEVTYSSKFGFEKTVKLETFKKDQYVDEVLFRFKELFKRNIILSLLNEIVIIIALFIYSKLIADWNYEGLYKELPSNSWYSCGSDVEHVLTEQYLKIKKQLKNEEAELKKEKAQNIEESKDKTQAQAQKTLFTSDSKDFAESSNSVKTTDTTKSTKTENNTTLSVTRQTAISRNQAIFTEDN